MGKLPKIKNAKEEAEFWDTHSPLDFPDEFEEMKEPIVDCRGRKVPGKPGKETRCPPP